MKRIASFVALCLYCASLLAVSGEKGDKPAKSCNIQVGLEYAVDALNVEFSNTSAGSYDLLLWDFGDNTSSREANPKHTYKEEGTYKFCLTLINAERECRDYFCGEVYVFK